MIERIDRAAPRDLARIAGALYLVNIVAGFFAIGFVPAMLGVAGDAAATAHNIQANELLFRAGLTAHVVVTMTNAPMAVIFYELFKVVSRRLATLVVVLMVMATAVEVANLLDQFSTLTLLDGAIFSSALPAGQLHALAYLPVAMQSVSYDISTAFFGLNGLALGYLIYSSTFLPRLVGVLMVIDGLAYLVNSFAWFLAPGFATHLFPYIQLPALLGEGSLCLWLLIMGVNAARWTERASSAKTMRPAHA